MTGDGLLDIVSISADGGHIYEGLENGRFSALADAGEFRNGAITPGGPIKLIVFDADTDGDLDMLTYGGSVGTEFYLTMAGKILCPST